MIRVMIVEDEPPIANSLKRIIEAKDETFLVVNISINGNRAVEYIKENEVDLIFTDIKMPIMNGLELAKYISEYKSKTSVIIVSGFQDFEYAKKALKYNVIDYILKPISKNEVYLILEKYKLKYEEINKIGQRNLLEKNIDSENTMVKFNDNKQYGVLLCCFGTAPLTVEAIDLNFDFNLTNQEIEIMVGLISNSDNCICINGKSISEKIILFPAQTIKQVREVSNNIFDNLVNGSTKEVTLIMYDSLVNMNNMKNIFKLLRKELYDENSLYVSEFIVYGETKPKAINIDTDIDIQMIKALTSKNKGTIHSAVKNLVNSAVGVRMRQKNFIMFVEKYIMNFYDDFLDISQLAEICQQIEISITTSENKESLAKEFTEVLYFWLNPNKQNSNINEEIVEVANYIKINHKENISLGVLSKKFGMSSANLSRKFKMYYNMSVPEYVNNYRIELAIGLMNYDRNKMIKEISLDVGYNDQYYFSKTFKKIVGVWPTEYIGNVEKHMKFRKDS